MHSQQSSKTDSLEAKLQDTQNELKSNHTLLFEKANQISELQRDVDHRQSRLAALEETLQFERERVGKLESELAVAREKESLLRSEVAGCRQEVESTQRRAEERERSGVLTQQRFDELLNTLKTEYEKVQSAKYSVLLTFNHHLYCTCT